MGSWTSDFGTIGFDSLTVQLETHREKEGESERVNSYACKFQLLNIIVHDIIINISFS